MEKVADLGKQPSLKRTIEISDTINQLVDLNEKIDLLDTWIAYAEDPDVKKFN